jgi:hypothetical protein
MDRESGVVWLNDGVRDFGRRHDREGRHHAVRELLADLRDEEGTHTSASATAERVGDLEALKAVAALSLTTDDIENLVHKFCTLSVVTFRPIVASTGLAKHEVVWTEELAERPSTDGIHGARFEIDEDSARDELVSRSLQKLEGFRFKQ